MTVKLKIGESCKQGEFVCMSRTGSLRRYRPTDPAPLGVAAMYLRRGRIAEEKVAGRWYEKGSIDLDLTAVARSYVPTTFVSENLLPTTKRRAK